MPRILRAIYRGGAFIPQSPCCDLPENTKVQLIVNAPRLSPPQVDDPEQRKRILSEVVRGMRDRPVPPDAPRFTREELHERR